jgi:hypothetical protein
MKLLGARRFNLLVFVFRILLACLFLSLLPARAAVVIGPWLEGDTTTNVDVLVECDSADAMAVDYGPTTNYGMSAVTSVCWTNIKSSSDFIHRIKLPGLQPNMLYHYRLAGQGAATTDLNFATMAPTNLVAGITLEEAPLAVSNAVAAVANGRAVEKINRVNRLEGQQFYAYIADTLGPQLLTLNANGDVLMNAGVVPFADLPQAIRDAARTAVAGRLEVCRRATQTSGPFVLSGSQSPYVIDYLLEEDEPIFALLRETDGWVRASYGYYEDDPD